MNTVLVIAPHPDDETLGCGGTLLRHIANGDTVHWLIVTDMQTEYGFSEAQVNRRQTEIRNVAAAFSFSKVYNLGFPPTKLDTLPICDLVSSIGWVIKDIFPTIVISPSEEMSIPTMPPYLMRQHPAPSGSDMRRSFECFVMKPFLKRNLVSTRKERDSRQTVLWISHLTSTERSKSRKCMKERWASSLSREVRMRYDLSHKCEARHADAAQRNLLWF